MFKLEILTKNISKMLSRNLDPVPGSGRTEEVTYTILFVPIIYVPPWVAPQPYFRDEETEVSAEASSSGHAASATQGSQNPCCGTFHM